MGRGGQLPAIVGPIPESRPETRPLLGNRPGNRPFSLRLELGYFILESTVRGPAPRVLLPRGITC